jgi:hypothetical protein
MVRVEAGQSAGSALPALIPAHVSRRLLGTAGNQHDQVLLKKASCRVERAAAASLRAQWRIMAVPVEVAAPESPAKPVQDIASSGGHQR